MADYLVRFEKRDQATRRLVCVPYAGATAAVYRRWGALLPPDLELCIVDLPGRIYMRRPPATDMPALIDEVFPEVGDLADKPFILFGHSFGSVVAFEIVLRLQQEGARLPERLVVSARRAPHVPSGLPSVRDLSDASFVETIQQRYKAIPESILKEKEMMARLLPILREDIRLNEEYCAESSAKVKVPIRLLYGTEDRTATLDELKRWEELTDSTFEMQAFPGEHFFIDSATKEVIVAILKD